MAGRRFVRPVDRRGSCRDPGGAVGRRTGGARHEAARAAKLLTEACGFPVHVEGVIAPVNAIEVTIKTASKDVHVVPRRQIAKWLLRHGDVLPPEQQAELFDVARRSTTWK